MKCQSGSRHTINFRGSAKNSMVMLNKFDSSANGIVGFHIKGHLLCCFKFKNLETIQKAELGKQFKPS